MNLKAYLDAANAAEARVSEIARNIDELFTAEKIDQALALRPDLDGAKAQAQGAHQLYLSMLNATSGGPDPAQRFMPADGNLQVTMDEADQPFANPGEFFKAVKVVGQYPGREDPRLRSLKYKDATGLSEGVPAEGGYLLQKQVNDTMIQRMYNTGQLLSRVAADLVVANFNGALYNGVDESTRAATLFGGIVGYWISEAGTITPSKPKFYEVDLKLRSVAAAVWATDEQLSDTVNLAAWIGRTVPDVLRFFAEDAIYEGTGVGKPLGIMNTPALVSVLRTDANKVQFADIVNMWARRWPGFQDYVWLCNSDTMPQLDQLVLASSTEIPTRFIDYGGPNGTMRMKGKPVMEVEYCATLGTTGDIMLASLSNYQTINKGDVQEMSSIHVAFLANEQVFRFTYRIDGKSLWNSALTPLHGSATQSPFVCLTSAST